MTTNPLRFAIQAVYPDGRPCGIVLAKYETREFSEISLADFQRRFPNTDFAIFPITWVQMSDR